MSMKSVEVPGAIEPVLGENSPAPAALKRAVCQVWVNLKPGTGFLVAPGVVLTTYHHLARVVSREVDHRDVTISFDNGEETFKLADEWKIAASPPSAMDVEREPKPRQPSVEELDYALVRLIGTPGEARGVLRPSPDAAPVSPGTPLHIIQYPGDRMLWVAHHERGVIGVNPERTRVRYRTWTRPASSGSPCFDRAWQLVAMHHATSPDTPVPLYNQGIPIHTLRDSLPPAARRELGW